MTILGVCVFVLGIIFLSQALISSSWNDKITVKALLGGLLIPLGFSFIMAGMQPIIYNSEPQAIDVYRGKTILQITYKNSIPIDTTVIYK